MRSRSRQTLALPEITKSPDFGGQQQGAEKREGEQQCRAGQTVASSATRHRQFLPMAVNHKFDCTDCGDIADDGKHAAHFAWQFVPISTVGGRGILRPTRTRSEMDAQAIDPTNGALKRRLGRGLNALLGSSGMDDAEGVRPATIPMHAPSAPPAPGSDEISLELIERNPFQPRRDFDQASIDELADSIRKHGLLQPLLVRAKPDGEAGYQLIAGERRWRAAQQVGMETVPCRVIEFEDRQASEAALEENLKREDLNVLEKARAFKDYLDRFGGTIEELARQLSMSRANVSNMMRLLELPDAVQKMLREDRISNGHARAILPLSETQQCELARQIEQDQLSVRRTEEIVRDILKAGTLPVPTDGSSAAPSEKPSLSNHVLSLQDHLRTTLGAKIDIKLKKNDAGQIVIHFSNNDDFERIVGQLRNPA